MDKNKHLYLQENKIKREEKEGNYDMYNIIRQDDIEDFFVHMLDSEEQWKEI